MLVNISDILLITIAIIWLVAACITDLRKKEVPNWLSFSLIAIALAIRGVTALLTSQPLYFLYALIALAIFFVVVNIFYYGRIFGGGDAKLLLALAAILATAPFFARTYNFFLQEPFLLTFVVNMFVLGFVYAFGFSIVSAIKNKKRFSIKFKEENKKLRYARLCCWICAIIALAAAFFAALVFRPLILLLFVVLFLAPLLYSFIKAVENSTLIRRIKPNGLAEGDWLVKAVRVKNKTIKPGVHGLSLKDIALLKKANKPVLIKIGLPFVPIFLIALICSLLFGNLLTRFILLFI